MGREWERYQRLAAERPAAFAPMEQLSIVMDEAAVRAFEERTGTTIGVRYESDYHLLVVDLVEDGTGRRFAYERLLPAASGPAVVTVPLWEGRYVLLRQWRHPLRGDQYAFPRGFGEPGLSAGENARKELEEELGVRVLDCRPLGTIAPDSGVSGDRAAVMLCRVTEPVLKPGYEGIAELALLTEKELISWVAEGRIDDGPTLSALCLKISKK